MCMLFVEESCQSAENKMALFTFGLLLIAFFRAFFKIDDPYGVSKLKTSEPRSAGLQTEPVEIVATDSHKLLTLTHNLLFRNSCSF